MRIGSAENPMPKTIARLVPTCRAWEMSSGSDHRAAEMGDDKGRLCRCGRNIPENTLDTEGWVKILQRLLML